MGEVDPMPKSHSLKSVKDTMVFDKPIDWFSFQTGKGHNDYCFKDLY